MPGNISTPKNSCLKVLDFPMIPICKILTPFDEKFGAPRQSLLIPEAWGIMEFQKNDFYSEAFRGLESFSHLWLLFEFNLVEEGKFKALIRPPRYEGKKKFGVFATRAPHRPNRIGLSVVKFEKLETINDKIFLWVSGVDLVNETPIFDIKPYLPYADIVSTAKSHDFHEAPRAKLVCWLCEKPLDAELIEKVVALDPRPGHDKIEGKEFGFTVAGINVRFKEVNNEFQILRTSKASI